MSFELDSVDNGGIKLEGTVTRFIPPEQLEQLHENVPNKLVSTFSHVAALGVTYKATAVENLREVLRVLGGERDVTPVIRLDTITPDNQVACPFEGINRLRDPNRLPQIPPFLNFSEIGLAENPYPFQRLTPQELEILLENLPGVEEVAQSIFQILGLAQSPPTTLNMAVGRDLRREDPNLFAWLQRLGSQVKGKKSRQELKGEIGEFVRNIIQSRVDELLGVYREVLAERLAKHDWEFIPLAQIYWDVQFKLMQRGNLLTEDGLEFLRRFASFSDAALPYREEVLTFLEKLWIERGINFINLAIDIKRGDKNIQDPTLLAIGEILTEEGPVVVGLFGNKGEDEPSVSVRVFNRRGVELFGEEGKIFKPMGLEELGIQFKHTPEGEFQLEGADPQSVITFVRALDLSLPAAVEIVYGASGGFVHFGSDHGAWAQAVEILSWHGIISPARVPSKLALQLGEDGTHGESLVYWEVNGEASEDTSMATTDAMLLLGIQTVGDLTRRRQSSVIPADKIGAIRAILKSIMLDTSLEEALKEALGITNHNN